jgi:hypothetical protein
VAPDSDSKFTLHNGILRSQGRIWLGPDLSLQQQIISALHDSPQGGHSRFPVTYRRVSSLFKWPGMKMMVHEFVHCCHIFQQAKPERVLIRLKRVYNF